MLVKDLILVEKLNYKTTNISINVALNITLNNTNVELSFAYIPDKFQINQESVVTYINKLITTENFDLENLSAKIIEDLYDIAVPKHISLTLKQELNSIKTAITTTKHQPKFKINN